MTSITIIGNGMASIGASAFRDCSSLTSVTIGGGVANIAHSAFTFCNSLTEISVSEDNAYYCSENVVLFNKDKTKLIRYPTGKTGTSYSIPSGVTSIGDSAFHNCSSLTSIEIPESVTSIGGFSFYICKRLTSIAFGGTVEQWKVISFGSSWNESAGAYTVTCTDGTVAKDGTVTMK